MNKTLLYVADSISEMYNIDMEEAQRIVMDSWFPKILNKLPDYVQHYDADYWAKEIMDDVAVR
ncbi:MAG: hypothetical protein J1E40_00360 [Oscillospiraceae bacterium]|nr:hypothetical protein [Oscillospiraceae bacterium]